MCEGFARDLCSQVESCGLGGMVGTSIAKTEDKKDGICTHEETGIRGIMGVYEKGFALYDDAGL